MRTTTKKLAGKVSRNPLKSLFLFFLATVFLTVSAWLISKNQNAEIENLPLLGKRIYDDVENLRHTKHLPSQVDNLKSVKIAVHTKDESLKRALLQNILFPFRAKKDGHFSIQVDVIEDFSPTDEPQVILQFNLYENLSKNKIWEFSRLYKLSAAEIEEIKTLANNLPPSLGDSPPTPDAPDGPEQTATVEKKKKPAFVATAAGLKLVQIGSDSLYQKLGLQVGDVLKSYNGKPLENEQDLKEFVRTLSGKTKLIKVQILRNNRPLELTYQIN